MIKKIAVIALTAVVLNGCSVTVPVVAKMEDNATFLGQAKGGLTMKEGTIEMVSTQRGVSCAGTYDQWSFDSFLSITMKCDDGSKVIASIMRDKTTMNGSGDGVATYADGTKEHILIAYGDNVLKERHSPAFWKQIDGKVE